VGIVWRECDMIRVYKMWGWCGENVTCLEFIICGDCVEHLLHIWSL
jgi:hypothetical protein